MKTQQQAEREEQQRIKNLVLNYDLRESEDPDGDSCAAPLTENTNIYKSESSGHEKPPSYHPNRPDKSIKERSGQRVRRLQLSDVDWYGRTPKQNNVEQNAPDTTGRSADDSVEGDNSAPSPVDKSNMNKRRIPSTNSRYRQQRGRGRGKR